MKSTNTKRMERLISEQWPKLKKEAQNETDTERLIAILEEIDDLLFSMEMAIAAQDGKDNPESDEGSRSASRLSFFGVPPGDSEIGGQ